MTLDGIDGVREPRPRLGSAIDAVWSADGEVAMVRRGAVWAGRPGRLRRIAPGSGNGNGSNGEFPADAYSFSPRVAEPEIIFNEHARAQSPTTIEELGSAFNASGLGSLSVPPALAGGSRFDEPSSTLNPPADAGGTDRFGRGNNGQNL